MAIIRRSSTPSSSQTPAGLPLRPLRRRRWLPLHRRRRLWSYARQDEVVGSGLASLARAGHAATPRPRRPSWLVAGWRAFRTWVARLVAVAGIVGVVAVAFTGSLRSYSPAEVIPPAVQANGLWLGYRWFSGDFDPADLARLIARVQANHLQSLFVCVGPVDADGRLACLEGEGVDRIAAKLRETGLDSSVRLFAWVQGEAGRARSSVPPTFRLERRPARVQLQRELRDLLQRHPFAGLHVEVRGVADGDALFVTWLAQLREAVLAPGQALSVAVPPLRSRWLPGLFREPDWSTAYLARVVARADQLAVRTFDTGLPLPGLYQRWLEEQVSGVLPVVAAQVTPRPDRESTVYPVLFAIPSFAERRFNHYPSVENVGVASQALVASFARAGLRAPAGLSQRIRLGYGLFTDWTTQDDEWEALNHYWR